MAAVRRSRSRFLTATNALVVLNVLAYLWEIGTGGLASDRALVDHGAIYGPFVSQGQWWRIVTGAFLHGGWLHIGLNMFALLQVGSYLEMLVGARRMLLTYFLSMIGSGIIVVLFSYTSVTVGASGAIFGVFGALAAIGLRLGPRGRGLVQQTVPIILLNLVLGFTIPNISSAAHIGGLLTGFLVGFALVAMHRAPQRAGEVPLPATPAEVEAESVYGQPSQHMAEQPSQQIYEPPPQRGEPQA